MDYGTIIGVFVGFTMILMSIITSGGSLASYLNLPSVLVVLFGSFAAMMVANPLTRMLGIMRYVRNALRVPDWQEQRIIEELVRFSDKARKEGLLALEDDLETIEDEFMRKGIRLVVDGTDPEIIKNILYNDLEQLQDRHGTGIKIFDDWGKIAPAFRHDRNAHRTHRNACEPRWRYGRDRLGHGSGTYHDDVRSHFRQPGTDSAEK